MDRGLPNYPGARQPDVDASSMARKLNKNDVFLLLRKSISDGEFQSGERLPPERELAREFGVARGTLREGLRELENAGLVERRQGSGTYVIHGSDDNPQTILEVVSPLELVDSRLAIEPHICRKAVLHATDCLLYTSPSPRDGLLSRMPSSA